MQLIDVADSPESFQELLLIWEGSVDKQSGGQRLELEKKGYRAQ